MFVKSGTIISLQAKALVEPDCSTIALALGIRGAVLGFHIPVRIKSDSTVNDSDRQ